MAKDFVAIRNSIDRLKELGLPNEILFGLNAWLEREKEKDELLKTTNPIKRMGIGEK